MEIYKGNIVFTPEKDEFKVFNKGYIVVEDGVICFVGEKLPERYAKIEVRDYGEQLIIPGFVDIHVHAPQWSNVGVGFSMELLPWLETYTFPTEAKFSDMKFAEEEYHRFVNELLFHGTTRAVVFASKHKEATKILMKQLEKTGIRAYVGKVNMDRNSIPELIEKTEESIRDTEELIRWMENSGVSKAIEYILTPRFVPSTTEELMQALGALGKKYNLPVQSHLDENRDEVKWVQSLHPDRKNFADVYNHFGLMRKRQTIMAHCIYMNKEEMRLLKEKEVLIAHCAMSNADLASGIMPLRKYLDYGLKVAIASDMGGSHSVNMMDHIVETIKCSKLYWINHMENRPITFAEAFYLATKAGGEFFGKVGSFEVGYEFDALVIDDSSIQSNFSHSILERVERFVYLGASRCIKKRFVAGIER